MRIYQIAFRNKMDVAANQIAKDIVDNIRKWYYNAELRYERRININRQFEYDGFDSIVQGTIRIMVKDKNFSPPFFVDATYKALSSSQKGVRSVGKKIEINIVLSTYFSPKNFNDFYMNIVEVVRHELEHYSDDMSEVLKGKRMDYNADKLRSIQGIKEDFDERVKYLFSKFEQIPFIRGMMMECKKRKIPLSDSIRKFVHSQLFGESEKEQKAIKKVVGELQAEHIEQLLVDRYLSKSNEIFPNMQ